MAGNRRDPYAAFNFKIEIGGETVASFAECSGVSSETEVIEYREGTDPTRTRKLPGIERYSNVTLKRGIAHEPSLWNWRKQISDGQLDRRNVSIILLDQARTPVLRWNLRDAWPCKWQGPTLNAKANEVAIETLELTHEGLEVEFE